MSLHALADHHTGKAPKRVTLILGGLVVVTLICGAWGFFGIGPVCGDSVWDGIYRLAALFEFSEVNLHIHECYPYPQIEIARFTGPAATTGVLIAVVMEVLRGPLERLKLQRFSGHTVIVGFGEKGKVRALEAAANGKQVVAIDNAPGETSHAVAARNGIVLLVGDAQAVGDAHHHGPLSRVRLNRAARVVVASGDDSRNLSIAQVLAGQVRLLPNADCEIEVSLSDPLIRRALDANSEDGLIDAFAIEDNAAHRLCESARFHAIADLLGQRRIHITMLGFDRLGVSVVAQMLRSTQLAGLGPTRITVLCADPAAARDMMMLSYPGIEAVADIAYVAADPRNIASNDALMAEVEAVAPITAIVVLGGRSADTLPVALAVRDASRRRGRWMAPIFFGIEHAASLMGVSRPISEEKRFSRVMHPFEISAHLCTRKYSDERDRVARELHEAYLKAFNEMQAAGEKPSTGNEALVPWRQLKQTYYQANRRAADHIAAKLLSAGCVVPTGAPLVTGDFTLLGEEGTLERLAELEHRVWAIDRELDGWRPGKTRDDARRIHDCLVPYAELTEPTKELDRAQVRELDAARLPRIDARSASGKTLVRFDLWVGIIGACSLTHAEASWAKDAFVQGILPRLLEAHPEHNITLLSALAPGAELVATKAMLEELAHRGVQHRLLVTEGVPAREVIDEFEAPWHKGAIGDLALSSKNLTWPQVRDALQASVAHVPCERIVELNPVSPGDGQEAREAGYRRQNAYIVQRAHIVIAVTRTPLSDKPGGIEEAIQWRRISAAMSEAARNYQCRPNRALPGFPEFIIVNASEHTIHDESAGEEVLPVVKS
ncbi:RyR domain-containing protein [Caballeronia ptereochthonis]|uniref:RyR domain protein n=1 Tax=Caballeronia ptereochthonis TaxID=1777144 RepID=A0A157ZZ54_9BURK|nr:RyR domain-containing protein [Caballeronia ptereochthonis]SAK50716.1 RyR domain protein [Caballeronia ptereochthonis]